jgi:glucokinase
VLNDANAFVVAEWRAGAGRGASSLVGLTLGTGVGGGIILLGRLWTGRNGTAGEIGHMPLLVDGPLCACGARGCLEALVGTRAILGRYRSARGRADVADDGRLTPQEIARRARSGDENARATYRETGRLLGLGLVGLTHLLDPERFVIGGGVAGAADLLLPAVEEALHAGAMLPARLLPRVFPASLGPDAGWIGAAFAARGDGPRR